MNTKDNNAPQAAKTELVTLYRPLGLKAVTAAHLMLKRKPASKTKPA
jgi:hypothetical protein